MKINQLLSEDFKEISLNYFRDKIGCILSGHPQSVDATNELIKMLSERFTSDFNMDMAKSSVSQFMYEIFGKIPFSKNMINGLLENYNDFIDFEQKLFALFSFDDKQLSNEIIMNVVSFIQENCYVEDADIEVNYSSKTNTWNIVSSNIYTKTKYVSSEKSFVESVVIFLNNRLKFPLREYLKYLKL